MCVGLSLEGEGVVVSVASWRYCGEKFRRGLQAGGVWWRLRLALRELEGPLVGHLLGLRVGALAGEGVHPVTEQTV